MKKSESWQSIREQSVTCQVWTDLISSKLKIKTLICKNWVTICCCPNTSSVQVTIYYGIQLFSGSWSIRDFREYCTFEEQVFKVLCQISTFCKILKISTLKSKCQEDFHVNGKISLHSVRWTLQRFQCMHLTFIDPEWNMWRAKRTNFYWPSA